jgi:putative membrane protein
MGLKRISGPVVVMGAWIMALAWLVHDDQYQMFLNPKFGFLIYISLGVSLAFLVSLLASDRPVVPETGHLVKGLILMLPIVFMGAAGDQTLGSFALSKRMLSPVQDTGTGRSVPADPKVPETILPDAISTESVTDSTRQADTVQPLTAEISMAELVRNWYRYNGRHIRVEGLFSKTIEGHDHLSAVFRYFITCCVADAMPVGVFLERPADPDLKDNDWLRVSGRVNMKQLDGYDIIFMEAPDVEKTDPPSKTSAYIFD